MSFHETQFPTGLSYGSRGGPGFSTNIIETDSGKEQRVARRSRPMHRYNAKYAVKSFADLTELRTFYMARLGCAYGFRFKDFLDCTSTSSGLDENLDGSTATANTDQTIGVGDGATTTFQLKKRYTSGPSYIDRLIEKPVTGTVKIALDGVNQASGWTVDTTTGIVTFGTAPGLGVTVTAGFYFDVPVRFGKELDQVLSISIDEFSDGSLDDIPLVEILSAQAIEPDFNFGGACERVIVADTEISIGSGRVQHIVADASGLKVKLPSTTSIPPGDPVFIIVNAGSVNNFDICKSDGTTLLAGLSPDQGVRVWLTIDGSGVKEWYLK